MKPSKGKWKYFSQNNSDYFNLEINKNKSHLFWKNINHFQGSLLFNNNEINSKIGDGEDEINNLTLSILAYNFYLLLKDKPLKNQNILVAHDESLNGYNFSRIFSKALASLGITTYNYIQNHSTPFNISLYTINKKDINYLVYFSSDDLSKEYLKIIFENKNYNNFNKSEIDILNSKVWDKKISATSENQIIELDNSIFDEYVSYIISQNTVNKNNNFEFSILNISENQTDFYDQTYRRLNYKFKKVKIKNKVTQFTEIIKKPNLKFYVKKLKWNMLLNKSKIGFIISNDSKKIYIFIKNKFKIIHLSFDSVASIYLKYLKDTENTKIKYFENQFSSFNSKDLAKMFLFKNITFKQSKRQILAETISSKKNHQYFSYDSQGSYLVGNKKAESGFDSLLFSIKFLEMFNYYENNNKNLVEVLKEVEQEYGISRSKNYEIHTEKNLAFNLIYRLYSLEKFNGQKIVKNNLLESDPNQRTLEIKLKDNTSILIIYRNFSKTLTYLISTPLSLDSIQNIIKKEREIVKEIESLREEEKAPSNFKKNFIKYSLFMAFLVFVFYFMYNWLYNVGENKSGGINLNIFKDIYTVLTRNQETRIVFIAIIFSNLIYHFLHSISIWLLCKQHNMNMKIRHILISSLISTFVSNITPLYVGGDLVSFWYLNKKGYKKSSLVSVFLASSAIFQLTMVISGIIIIPFIFLMFGNFLSSSNVESYFIFILLIIGLFINFIMSLIYWILASWKWLQIKIIHLSIWIAEVIPFCVVLDSNYKLGSYYNSFEDIRQGFKNITKNYKIFILVFFLKILSFLFSLSPFVALYTGMLKPNLPGGFYWYIFIGSNIVRISNSISFTPGGIGTSDFFNILIFNNIFENAKDYNAITNNGNLFSNSVSIVYSSLLQILFYVLPTIFSALILLNIWIGEKRNEKYRIIYKSVNLTNTNDFLNKKRKTKTSFYKITNVLWLIFLIGFIALMLYV